MKTIRQRVRVQENGRIEITDPSLVPGTEAEVVVLLPEPTGDGAMAAVSPPGTLSLPERDADGLPVLPPLPERPDYTLVDMIGAAPSGRTAEEVDRELRALRDEWDREERG